MNKVPFIGYKHVRRRDNCIGLLEGPIRYNHVHLRDSYAGSSKEKNKYMSIGEAIMQLH